MGIQKEFLDLTVLDIRPEEEKQRLIDLLDEVKNGHLCKCCAGLHITRNGNQLIMNITAHHIQYGKKANAFAGQQHHRESIAARRTTPTKGGRSDADGITEAVITGQEKERTQLGEELHDNINQILASTKLYLECSLKDEKPRADLVNESKLLVEKAMTEIEETFQILIAPFAG